MTPRLDALLKRAKEWWDNATEAEREDMLARQRRSYVLAEIGMGNDEDELAYRYAYARGDTAEMKRLHEAGVKRMEQAARIMDGKPSEARSE